MHPDNIVPGKLVTVHHWHPREVLDVGFEGEIRTFQDRSYCGDPLLVEEVCLPYILVRKLNERTCCPFRSLCIHELEFIEISERYMELMVDNADRVKRIREMRRDLVEGEAWRGLS